MSSGWFPDPEDPNLSRYWDGSEWTASSRTGPPVAPSPGPPTSTLPAATPPPGPGSASRRRRWILPAAAAVVVVALAAGVAWWTLGRDDRSVEAFCRTWSEEVARLGDTVDLTGQNPLGVLSGGISAIDELPDALGRVADVSPEDIAPDVSDLRDAALRLREATKDGASDPLSLLTAAGGAALSNGGAVARVAQYVDRNC